MGNWPSDLWKKVELLINLILVHGRKGLLVFGNSLRSCKYIGNYIRHMYNISLSSLLTVSEHDRMCFVYDFIPSSWRRAKDDLFMKIDICGKSKVYFSWKPRHNLKLNLRS